MKKPKPKLALIETEQQKQERTEALHRKWKAIQKEQEKYSLTGEQLHKTIRRLIDDIDRHLIEQAFNFRNDTPSGEHDYLTGILDKLTPFHTRGTLKKNFAPHCQKNMPGNRELPVTI